ncbi:hypothetical protein CDL12_22397 [Handroanthus impetiginosus]|uniref:NAC domain-containing protein n=1 Tax=Handroanthus impetiginosus TaxID=429701 RepID=A0A2G9GIE0_9LAMI|nr:hypothetical protein CDL12_22397 [Handroanthus impetiginosus]
MGLRDIGHTLPPGFRFYPSDEELVCHYLYKKIANEEVLRGTLVEIDLHTCEPWQLPDVAKLNSNEWYFFSFRDRKYATGFRTNRATTSGYWKATGKDRPVLDPTTRAIVGMRKTLVFYKNRAPNGTKTGWIMHEFRLENPHVPPKEDWVLCRVFHKSRSGDHQDINKFNPQNLYDNNNSNISPNNLSTSPIQNNNINKSFSKNIPAHHDRDQYHNQIQNPTISMGLAAPDTGYYHPSDDRDQYMNGPHPSSSNHNHSTKCEDDYGFLFDMSMEYNMDDDHDDMRFDHAGSVYI